MAQLVKNLPAMWETCFRSLGWKDSLEKGKLPTPVFWLGEFLGLCVPWGHKESERLSLSLHIIWSIIIKILNHYVVHLKVIYYCKSIILQFKFSSEIRKINKAIKPQIHGNTDSLIKINTIKELCLGNLINTKDKVWKIKLRKL